VNENRVSAPRPEDALVEDKKAGNTSSEAVETIDCSHEMPAAQGLLSLARREAAGADQGLRDTAQLPSFSRWAKEDGGSTDDSEKIKSSAFRFSDAKKLRSGSVCDDGGHRRNDSVEDDEEMRSGGMSPSMDWGSDPGVSGSHYLDDDDDEACSKDMTVSNDAATDPGGLPEVWQPGGESALKEQEGCVQGNFFMCVCVCVCMCVCVCGHVCVCLFIWTSTLHSSACAGIFMLVYVHKPRASGQPQR
jgi:hypothetical protein